MTKDSGVNISLLSLQNQLGVSVLFTWGVVAENNSNHIAVVPGGWVEEYLEVGRVLVYSEVYCSYT
jgi:hypothetical protein